MRVSRVNVFQFGDVLGQMFQIVLRQVAVNLAGRFFAQQAPAESPPCAFR